MFIPIDPPIDPCPVHQRRRPWRWTDRPILTAVVWVGLLAMAMFGIWLLMGAAGWAR